MRKICWRRDGLPTPAFLGLPGSSAGKESTHNAGDPGSIPGSEDPLEKGKATDSSILTWRIPRTVQSVGLQSQTRLSDFHSQDYPFLEKKTDLIYIFYGWISDSWEQACSGHILAWAVQQESGDVRILNSSILSLVVHE